MSKKCVFVVEMMMVRHFPDLYEQPEKGEALLLLGSDILPSPLVSRSSRREQYYEGLESSGSTIFEVEFVVESERDLFQDEAFRGEYVTVRSPGEGEIFDGERELLVLYPDRMTEISGDFGQEVFQGSHRKEVRDASLRLFEAAFDLLLDAVGKDFERCYGRSWPDELPDAITDTLQNKDLSGYNLSDILALANDVITGMGDVEKILSASTIVQGKPHDG